MNKVYRVIWSQAKQAYVVVSEIAKIVQNIVEAS